MTVWLKKLEVFLATHFLAVHELNSNTWENLIQESIRFSTSNFKPLSKKFDKKFHVASLFLEPSTRTTLSFSLAAHNLNCTFNSLEGEKSSISKGETLEDTLLNFEAMGISATVVRLKNENQLHLCSQKLTSMSLISAGEGKISHPSQALADACTIYEQFKKLNNLKVLFLGDIEHSRVYVSNCQWMSWFDNQIYYFSPQSKNIIELRNGKVHSATLEDSLENFDVVIMLRPQLERHESSLNLNMNLDSYHQQFGITATRIIKMKPNAILMHPGPFYPNIEIAAELLKNSCVKIYRQVYWGVFARMSIYSYVLRDKNE